MYTNHYEFCSGTLPYAYFNNSIYVLLGKNKRGRLVTFSGKNEGTEGTQDTAAREMYEETCGIIMSKQETLHAINSNQTILLDSKTPSGKRCYIYMIQIPYRKWYTLAFCRVQALLKEVMTGTTHTPYTHPFIHCWI